jgi:hypothetical protein
MRLNSKYFLLMFALFAGVVACDDDDNDFSTTPAIGFEALGGQISENEPAGKLVTFYTNIKVTEPITLTVQISAAGVAYGTDYTTTPAAVDNKITFTINPDEENPGFMVYPIARPELAAGRRLDFEITNVSGGNVALTETNARYYALTITKEVQIAYYEFEDCSGTPLHFTEVYPATGAIQAASWGCTTFGYSPATNAYTGGIEANAYGKGDGTSASNAYLITKVDASDNTSLVISMLAYSHYTGAGTLSVRYSDTYSGTGNPEAAGVTWTTLKTVSGKEVDADIPGAGTRTWKQLNGVIEGTAGKPYYIALQYKGATKTSASNWRIDNFKIVGRTN